VVDRARLLRGSALEASGEELSRGEDLRRAEDWGGREAICAGGGDAGECELLLQEVEELGCVSVVDALMPFRVRHQRQVALACPSVHASLRVVGVFVRRPPTTNLTTTHSA